MKKFYFLLFTILISFASFGQIILTENFTYSDGSLVGNGVWANHSGTPGDLLVSSGEAIVQHGAPSEDASVTFAAVAGTIYAAFDFSVDDLGSPYAGTDNEYFAHFMVGTGNFTARLDVVPPSASGDYSVGISTLTSTAEATWASDLTYGTTYRATIGYNQDTNQAQLWIDASVESDTSILGSDQPESGNSITAFALRQSDSSVNETVRVDNLIISQTFNESLSTKQNQINDFKVYPNPTSLGYINISSRNNTEISVSVFDVLGKLVINKTVINNRLDVSNLKSGVYIMKAKEQDAVSTKKLVIR